MRLIASVDPDQWLTSCDDEALLAGANLALIGEELIQFRTLRRWRGRFRLKQFLRGRSGMESVVPSHVIGDIFCLVEARSIQSIQLPIASIGTKVTAQLVGGGSTSLTVRARAGAITGTIVDREGGTSIDQILATLRQDGLIST
jgi:hypothetical protein